MSGVSGRTLVAGVWGWPVRHSASPAMHNAAFAALGLDWVYVPFAVDPDRVREAVAGVRALGIVGVNVTVPLKERVGEWLDDLTPTARRLGAVNTIFRDGDALVGDSTDGDGFLAALAHAGHPPIAGATAVVLGAGGSARAVVDALARREMRVVVANRTVERAEALRALGAGEIVGWSEDSIGSAVAGADLVVNTTSLGMTPNADTVPPVPAGALHPGIAVVDLVYNPPRTLLMERAVAMGAPAFNGLEMLVRQGALSFERWTGQAAPVDAMRGAVRGALGIDVA
ncbi:MAG: shikimate dehydrogenase [Armatimonadota bacterium]